jgi:hypothetical protein
MIFFANYLVDGIGAVEHLDYGYVCNRLVKPPSQVIAGVNAVAASALFTMVVILRSPKM